MLALSVRQPWADAIVHGGKDIENRTRLLNHRGPLLIHASAGMTGNESAAFNHFLDQRGLPTAWQDKLNPYVRRGGIIGLVEVVDAVRASDSPWWMGPCGLVLRNPRPLPFIPCRGTIAPLFWSPPVDVLAQVNAALAA